MSEDNRRPDIDARAGNDTKDPERTSVRRLLLLTP